MGTMGGKGDQDGLQISPTLFIKCGVKLNFE